MKTYINVSFLRNIWGCKTLSEMYYPITYLALYELIELV